MTSAPQDRRSFDSYESACEHLKAQPLEPNRPLPARGDFGEMSFEDLRQLAAHSLPPPIRLIAYPLDATAERPDAVAEFAAELLLQRDSNRLRLADPHEPPPFGERANLRWIVWGDLIASPGGHLALGPLSIGPYPGAESELEPAAAPYRGVTSEVLRAIPIGHLIDQIVDYLRRQVPWQQGRAAQHGWRTTAEQREQLDEALARLSTQAQTSRNYPEHHYRDVALLYLDLLERGHGQRVLLELAHQLGISHHKARNWVHRARQLGYLAPGTRGRAGALPGPKLSG